MRKTKEMRKLECVLTDANRLNYSKELSETIQDKARHEDSLKSFTIQAKAEIQGCQEKINLLASKLSTGKEYREVEVEIVYNWQDGKRYYTRTDTGAIVDFETIPPEDMQEWIDLHETEKKTTEGVNGSPLAIEDRSQECQQPGPMPE